ncbi:MAG: hypothetical protein RMY28_036305 [Nostoc sp. ChiSLP01]|nr:hypothetical protein [Nostoc sp. CmiSLP01]MDZ8286343.1 hypothetical protein [Nostoc sp. ChiSLP01]
MRSSLITLSIYFNLAKYYLTKKCQNPEPETSQITDFVDEPEQHESTTKADIHK